LRERREFLLAKKSGWLKNCGTLVFVCVFSLYGVAIRNVILTSTEISDTGRAESFLGASSSVLGFNKSAVEERIGHSSLSADMEKNKKSENVTKDSFIRQGIR
jgi:hypothetical protein